MDYNNLDNLDESGWLKLIKGMGQLTLFVVSKAILFGGAVAKAALCKHFGETND
jgi:hypothetical protein